jgi:hypothetical protein
MKNQLEEKNGTSYGWLILLLALIIIAWAIGGALIYQLNTEWANRGQAGDMFGAVNALFTGCAFAALIFTIRQQSQELLLQREELKLTRGELSGQRAQMESQAITLKLQQFESTFFQLLSVHGEIVNAIDLVSRGGAVIKGRDCFKTFCSRFSDTMFNLRADSKTEVEQIRKAYREFYEHNESEVGHYFRHLYHIVKFVDGSEVDDKRRYVSFVRAQLSSYELQLLFYNCLSEYGNLYFKPLVEKYGLLKHLPEKATPASQRRYYQQTAFLSATTT